MSNAPSTSANLLQIIDELSRHYVVAAPGDERPFLEKSLQLLSRHGYTAAVAVLSRPAYMLSNRNGTVRASEPSAPPPDAIPVELEDRCIGWIFIADEGRNVELVRTSFTGAARTLLIAGAAANEMARQRASLDSLYHIGDVAARARSFEEILQTIYDQLSRFLEVEAFVGALYDEQQNEMELALRYDRGQRYPPVRRPVTADGGMISWMLANHQAVLIRDMQDEALPTQPVLFGDTTPVRSWMGALMEAQGRVVGALSLQSYKPNTFDEGDLRLLTQIAQQAAQAIIIHQDRATSQRRLEELTLLNELSRELGTRAAELPLVELLEVIRQRLSRLVNTANFYIALYHEATDTVNFALATEEGQRRPWRSRQAGQGLTEHLIRNGAPVRIPNNVDEYLRQIGIESIGRSAEAWLGVPLWLGGRVIGGMVIQEFNEGKTYTQEDERLMVAAASQVAGVIQIAWLLAEEQRQRAELEAANQQQANLLDVIRQLSTPVVPIFEGVLAVPLIGTFDSDRTASVMEELLHTVASRGARVVLLDITGVPVVDTAIANHLVQTIRAVQLLGAHCALVGIRPEVAQTMIGLGVDLQDVVTLASLQDGVAYALALLGLQVASAGLG